MDYKHVTFEDLEDYLKIDDYFSSFSQAEKDEILHNLGLDTIPASFCEDRERISSLFKALTELKECHKYNGIFSRDFGEFEQKIDETYSDRASKDALGNVIADTYITRDGLSTTIMQQVNKAVWNTQLPNNSVGYNNLTDELKQQIGSGNTITNNADGEDLSVVNNVLKFADKTYDNTAFSGMGRKFLRKNMTDGINYLEQYMINQANTIYIIQYDYCVNASSIIIPENCILLFLGGSISNGTLKTSNQKSVIKVFDITGGNAIKDVILEGEFIDIITGYEINKLTHGISVFKPTFYNNIDNIGFVYYDETLKKPIWWNGENWIDATGKCVTEQNDSNESININCNCNTIDPNIVTDKSEIL